MKAVWATYLRELRAYFFSPLAYLVLFFFLVINGITFYAFLWAPTLAYAGIISYNAKVDWGPVAAGYVGILGIGAMFLAVGVFASAMSKNQLVAAIITFALLILLFSIGFLENLVNGDLAKRAIGYVNLLDHMDEFAKGIVDSRHLVYYLSTTLFFLFLTSRALADRKWR